MNKRKAFVMVMMAILSLLSPVSVYSGDEESPLLTFKEVKSAWNGRYETSHDKRSAMLHIMDRMRTERREEINQVESAKIEKYLLDEILKTEAATIDDCDGRALGEFYLLDFYLIWMSEWDCMKEKTALMKVAGMLARINPLPDLESTEAMKLAWQIDDYLKYGTNKPPRRFGVTRRWGGPATERVYQIMNFRRNYNADVAELRRKVLECYRKVILDERDKTSDEASRQALWEEFVEVTGLPSEKGKE